MQIGTEIQGGIPTANWWKPTLVKRIVEPLWFLFRHRALIWAMAQRDMVAPYAGQMLGGVWAIVHPLFLVILLTVVFNFLLGGRFGGTFELPLDYNWLAAMTLLGEVCAYLKDAVRAPVLYEKLLPFAGQKVTATGKVSGLVSYLISADHD